MTNYFENLRLFEKDEAVNVTCECKKKRKKLEQGKFTIIGKSFYVKRMSMLFGNFSSSIWKNVIDVSYEIIKNGYIPKPHPFIMFKKGVFTGEIYIEIIYDNTSQNNNKAKIKTFTEEDNYHVLLKDSDQTSKTQLLTNLYLDVFKMPHMKKRAVLKKLFKNKIYQVLFHCPLCDLKDPIPNVFFV